MDILILLMQRIFLLEKYFYILSIPVLAFVIVLIVNYYILDGFKLYVLEVDGKEFKYVRVHFSLFRRQIVIFAQNGDEEIIYYSHVIIRKCCFAGKRKELKLLKELDEKENSLPGEKGIDNNDLSL